MMEALFGGPKAPVLLAFAFPSLQQAMDDVARNTWHSSFIEDSTDDLHDCKFQGQGEFTPKLSIPQKQFSKLVNPLK